MMRIASGRCGALGAAAAGGLAVGCRGSRLEEDHVAGGAAAHRGRDFAGDAVGGLPQGGRRRSGCSAGWCWPGCGRGCGQ